MNTQWNVVITGFGTVGWHVADLLERRRASYSERYGVDVRLTAISGSRAGLHDPNGLTRQRWEPLTRANGGVASAADASPVYTGESLLAKVEADVLIETGPTDFRTGGPGLAYIKAALERGIHAIAVSKGALVADYPGLAGIARRTGAALKISGATAAALPTIDLIEYNLAGCEVTELCGILTGTANYVLTRISEDGWTLAQAVAEAKWLGIAEPDPAFDLDGWDTACKLVILANAAFGASLRLDDVSVEGIGEIGPEEMDRWSRERLVPKLIGRMVRTERGVTAEVKRMLLPHDHPLARVRGTTKAVWVQTDVMGDLLVMGGKSDPRAAAAAALKDLEHLLGQHVSQSRQR